MVRNPHEVAADLVKECGPYATMAALFLASESREEDNADGAIFWMRIAATVSENKGTRATGLCMYCYGGAGNA